MGRRRKRAASEHRLVDKDLKQYIHGQPLGNESRSVEFKEGGWEFMNSHLRDTVAKYVCGFLNSGESGTLMLGVRDDGTVVGVQCTQKDEDRYRCSIDEAIKEIMPNIFPDDYGVEFVNVIGQYGNAIWDNKVIEIHVLGKDLDSRDSLYETRKGVYMRMDGSLNGPLKAHKIQEWTKLKFKVELLKMEKSEKNKDAVIAELLRKTRDQQNEIKAVREQLQQAELVAVNKDAESKDSVMHEMATRLQDSQDTLDMVQGAEARGEARGEARADELADERAERRESMVLSELQGIKTMLEEQRHKKQSSKVCVIS